MALLARDPATGAGPCGRHAAWEAPAGVLVVRSDRRMFHANAVNAVKERVLALAAAAPEARLVVLELSENVELDVGTLDMLEELVGELAREGVELRFAAVRRPAQELMRRSGLADRVRIELTVDDAAAGEPAGVPTVGDEAER